jgi:hypothetical protein
MPRELLHTVLARIEFAHRRAAAFRVAALGTVTLLSGASLYSAISYASNEFYTSGFYDFLSLLFSDSATALSHWQEISLSLAESLPSLAILLLLSITTVFLWSLRHTVRDVKVVFRTRAA